jgi:activator of 2-hydroxyglutaryl-CoA dehydratase
VNKIEALGIDVGSTTVKIVGVDAAGDLVWSFLEPAEP